MSPLIAASVEVRGRKNDRTVRLDHAEVAASTTAADFLEMRTPESRDLPWLIFGRRLLPELQSLDKRK
jgi:hypothetical protein